MENLFGNIVKEEILDEEFSCVAPLGNANLLVEQSIDCEVCCPGSCTGCTSCNKCNLLF
jgi:hypothetical protein